LIPFARVYSGLTDTELRDVERFVCANTKEKVGPVRIVTPQLMMELAFENVQLSRRHRRGVAVRFPRIVRCRLDKKPHDANTLDDLKQMIRQAEQGENA
jgi:DNA ligase 1